MSIFTNIYFIFASKYASEIYKRAQRQNACIIDGNQPGLLLMITGNVCDKHKVKLAGLASSENQ